DRDATARDRTANRSPHIEAATPHPALAPARVGAKTRGELGDNCITLLGVQRRHLVERQFLERPIVRQTLRALASVLNLSIWERRLNGAESRGVSRSAFALCAAGSSAWRPGCPESVSVRGWLSSFAPTSLRLRR